MFSDVNDGTKYNVSNLWRLLRLPFEGFQYCFTNYYSMGVEKLTTEQLNAFAVLVNHFANPNDR